MGAIKQCREPVALHPQCDQRVGSTKGETIGVRAAPPSSRLSRAGTVVAKFFVGWFDFTRSTGPRRMAGNGALQAFSSGSQRVVLNRWQAAIGFPDID
jgi:hypothetical protein